MSPTICLLLSLALFVGSAVDASFQDLVFAFKFVFEFILKLLAFSKGDISHWPFPGLQSRRFDLVVIVGRTLRHLAALGILWKIGIAQDVVFQT